MPYRAERLEIITNCSDTGMSTHGALGMFGGYPSGTVQLQVLKQTNIDEVFRRQRVPASVAELRSAGVLRLRGKSNGTPLAQGDLLVCAFPGGGGYGDPLEREPASVATDVEIGSVSRDAALTVYGVVIDGTGCVDADATTAQRAAILGERRSWEPAPELKAARATGAGVQRDHVGATGEPSRLVHENIVACDQAGERVLACSRCVTRLCGYRESFKQGLLIHEAPVTIIPLVSDPGYFIDDAFVVRRYCCPGCYGLVETEVARSGEGIHDEMRLL